ncbi:hypothetical protein SAMN06269185_1193 [Natronoarchaeum philippinense]|uniref:Uncharacterized protein n=1 Tax=Natronoarchaeum philippinense TaxID=558529 RepID=A0A285NAL1_NATPI|nr:hypothetical protein [Natronoarchaeum philippinense]SNZ06505.1 hypothetical protein SAMN06269185_1193 [Natronoarchaeum philippinense]
MTDHDTQTGDGTTSGVDAPGNVASVLRERLADGSAAYAVGGVSLVRALKAVRSDRKRAAGHALLGTALIALGRAQRQRDGDGGEPTGTTTEQLSSSTPEHREDDELSETSVANEPAEATGPTTSDAVPEQTESTEPETTPEADPNIDAEDDADEAAAKDDGADDEADE